MPTAARMDSFNGPLDMDLHYITVLQHMVASDVLAIVHPRAPDAC